MYLYTYQGGKWYLLPYRLQNPGPKLPHSNIASNSFPNSSSILATNFFPDLNIKTMEQPRTTPK